MKCLILANKVNSGLFPLTKELPAGLLPLKGKTALEWTIEDLETIGDMKYLMVSCDAYEQAVNHWKEQKEYGKKISVITMQEEAQEDIPENLLQGETEDILVIPSNVLFEFSLSEIVKYCRDERKTAVLVHGNEEDYEELPVRFYTADALKNGISGAECRQPEKIFVEGFCRQLDSHGTYEDLESGRGGIFLHNKFNVQAFTQERYGEIYISGISMDKQVFCKKKTQAELVIGNNGSNRLNGENTRISYRLWLEQPRIDSYIVDKIPVETDEVFSLPCTIEPGENKKIKLDITVPDICGKLFIRFDIENNGKWLAEGSHYLCFPTVTTVAEPDLPWSRAELLGSPKNIFVGMPESANAGEHLEAAALKEFVKKLLPERPCLEYPARKLEEYWKNCGRIFNQDDLIFAYGSGFMGLPEKMAEENFRRRTASVVAMPKIRLKMFIPPLHQKFEKSESGMQEVMHSATAYGGSNYYIYGANEEDYHFFLEKFEKTNVGKTPLLSFGMEALPDKEPEGDDFTVVVCGGSEEGFLDTVFDAIDKNGLRRMYLNLDYNAYQPGAFFGSCGRDFLIDFCSKTIQDTKAVVTDSYYGLAYALHCNRPCVIYGDGLDREWFSERDDVIFVDKLEEIEDACRLVLDRKGRGPLDETFYQPFRRQISMQE